VDLLGPVLSAATLLGVVAWMAVVRRRERELDRRLSRDSARLAEQLKTVAELATDVRKGLTALQYAIERVGAGLSTLSPASDLPAPVRVSVAPPPAPDPVDSFDGAILAAWRAWRVGDAASFEEAVSRRLAHVRVERHGLGTVPLLIILGPGGAAHAVPRKNQNWFIAPLAAWFEPEAGSPRKGVVVDVIAPAVAHKERNEWIPVKKGVVVIAETGA